MGTTAVFDSRLVEAHPLQLRAHPGCVLPALIDQLGLATHDPERRQDGGRHRRSEARGVHELTAVVHEVVLDLLRTADESTHRGERLRERSRDQVHVVGHAEVRCGAATFWPDGPDGVRLIDQDSAAVLPTKRDDLVHGRELSSHGVDAIHCEQLAAGEVLVHLQLALEVRHVVVLEANELGLTQDEPIDEAGVVFTIRKDDVLAVADGADRAGVRHEAGGPQEHRFLAQECRQLLFELIVQVQRPVEHPAARTPGAEAVKRVLRRRDDLWVVGEPQVVVGAEHDPRLALDQDAGALGVVQRTKEWVHTVLLGHLVTLVGSALVEEVFVGLGRHVVFSVSKRRQPLCFLRPRVKWRTHAESK